MTNQQLEALAHQFQIGGYGNAHEIDRQIIIRALRERDRALKPASVTHSIHVEHMHGSNIQLDSPGATATATYSIADQRELLEKVKAALSQLGLPGPDHTALTTDLSNH